MSQDKSPFVVEGKLADNERAAVIASTTAASALRKW